MTNQTITLNGKTYLIIEHIDVINEGVNFLDLRLKELSSSPSKEESQIKLNEIQDKLEWLEIEKQQFEDNYKTRRQELMDCAEKIREGMKK